MAAQQDKQADPSSDASAAVSASSSAQEKTHTTPDTSREAGPTSPKRSQYGSPDAEDTSAMADTTPSSGVSPPSADPDASLTLRALVSTKEAGVIIGKGGSNVAELRDQTGVKAGVSKVVPGVHDRVLSVSGTVDGISKAYSLIAQTILDNPVTNEPSETGSTAIRLLVSHALMGTVIGKAGLTIKHIQDVSGARMVASKEMLPGSNERMVEVQGTPAAIKTATAEIAKCLLDDWERGQGAVLYQPESTEGAGVLAVTGAGGLQPQGPYGPLGGVSPGPGGRGAGGLRRSSGPGYPVHGMAAMSLAPAMAPPGAQSMPRAPRASFGATNAIVPTAPMLPPPIPAPVAASPAAAAAAAAAAITSNPVAAAAAVAAPAARTGTGVEMLANPATAPYATHIASLQHQSVFAPTGIPAGSATRPSAIADAAAQGAAVAPGGGLVAGGMTGAGPSTAPAVVDAANLRTQNISIPSDMVGCIIGKGGSKITEIRRLSGSRISIAKVAHDDSGERMFTIQGTPESNEKALFLLYNQLENEKERRTASGTVMVPAAAEAV